MADSDGHFGPPALDALHRKHRKPNTTEDGACLTGHDPSFSKKRNKVTCNYRYQAYEQAQSHKGIRDALHSYEKVIIRGPIRTSSWKKNKPEYCANLPKPKKGDWHVTGPNADVHRTTFAGKKVTIPATMNFTQELWPYWNNAHHLIPKGTLKEKILAERDPIPTLIQKALLQAQYNINHKVNMLFMPQDKRVANILGLPRHIQLREGDAPGIAASCGNHPVYNKWTCEIDRGLNSIIANYRKICQSAIRAVKGTHRVPKPTLDKKRLERLSRRLLKIILGAEDEGLVAKGQSLDAMADNYP